MTPDGGSLRGKRALVTGAGSGIGLASAKWLAAAGARVALLGRTAAPLDELLNELGGEQAGHLRLLADVASEEEMMAAADEIAGRMESLDFVLANAGINGLWAPLEELTAADWDKTMGINLRGTFLTVRASLPLLRKNGGSVAIVSSVNGNRMFSNTGATAYACSKAGQVAFMKMIALELARDRIRVNAICPGAIDTEIDDNTEQRDLAEVRVPVKFPDGQIPLTHGKPGTAEQVASLVGFLASDASSHLSGTEIYIDGAQSLLQG